MDRLDAMHTFVRVAELGSFTAVAQQLGVASSVVTRQVAALEAHLGVKLMARSTRHLTLTSAGAAYLEKCRVILNLVESAETDVAEERLSPRGHVRMSLPISFGLKRLSPLLITFSQRYPDVSLDMDYTDRRVNLIEESIDLSIRITGSLEGSDVTRKLGTSRILALASPEYIARHGRPRHPAELAHHECLGYTGVSPQVWLFTVDGQLAKYPIRCRLNSNNGDALTQAAIEGLGVTLQPDFIAAQALAAGQVVEILQDFAIPELGIYAMLPSNRQVPHRVRVLMDFLAEGLRHTGNADT